jgi:hypothetical protein
MSLEPKNIVVEGPDVFGNVLGFTFGEPSGVDAPPFYSSFTGSVVVNGSYIDGDFEYDYDSVLIETNELERIGLRDPLLGLTAFEPVYEVIRKTSPSAFVDVGGATITADGKCVACCGFAGSVSGQLVPLSVPFFASAGFPDFNPSFGAGMVTDNSQTPPVQSESELEASFFGPSFTGLIGDTDFHMNFSLSITNAAGVTAFTNSIDVSAWTTADFRDIRGTYSQTDYDANGIEYVWSVTIG